MEKEYNIVELDQLAMKTIDQLGKKEKSIEEAILILDDLRKKESNRAKYYIAVIYYVGINKRKNIKKAVEMFKELYEKDKLEISYAYLGECYYLGIGLEQNYEKARELFHICEDDFYIYFYTNPQYYLGEIYLLGKGVKRDYLKAKKYLNNVEKIYSIHKIYPYRLYYYLGNIEKIENNKNENTNNHYFNLIEEQILKNINNKEPKTYTIKDLYQETDKYNYKDFINGQNEKVISEYEKNISYLSESEFKEIINFIKIKIEKCIQDVKFIETFSKYNNIYENEWLCKTIIESYDYKSINEYVSEKIKQKDYETINFVGQLYLDGIVVEKDESKGNKYKKEAEDILDSSLNKLGKLCDKLFKDTKEN